MVDAFATAIADAFAAAGQVRPDLLRSPGESALEERGRQALESVCQLFERAAGRYRGEVRRSDPAAALAAVERMMTGAVIYRPAMESFLGGTTTVQAYGRQLSDMIIAYLRTPDHR